MRIIKRGDSARVYLGNLDAVSVRLTEDVSVLAVSA